MGHEDLKLMQGVNGREPTAFTKKTIKELLAEEVAEPEAVPLMKSVAADPETTSPFAEPAIKAEPVIEALEPRDEMPDQPRHKRRSLLARLLQR